MKKTLKKYYKIGFIFSFMFGLSSCGTYGTASSYADDLVQETKETVTLKPGGINQGGFLLARPPLVIPSTQNLNILPTPGSDRLLSLKSVPQKQAPKDAYSLYTQPYVRDDDPAQSLAANNVALPVNAVIKKEVLTKKLVVPPIAYFEPAKTAPKDDLGLTEARKELLRQEDPNLKPSKKSWLPGSKDKAT